MEITRGKIPGAKKVLLYGSEGIGKSTFASKFPDPLFIDTEGGTKELDVARTPAPSSWTALLSQIDYVLSHPEICKTLVVDTIDWAEKMCVEHVCASYNHKGIEDFGYGKGYTYAWEEFGRFLNKLAEIINKGIHVVLIAHAILRKFEQPDEMGAYDRWELKLGQKTSSRTASITKEWADTVLFANYKTYSVATDKEGKKHKAQGGKRVMYTSHHPCWDAKNRFGLPEEVEFSYSAIATIINEQNQQPPAANMTTFEKPDKDGQTPLPLESGSGVTPKTGTEKEAPPGRTSANEKIPKPLRDLMEANNVGEWDIQNVVMARGYYPSDMPIENYDTNFINGVLVAAWPQVFKMIQDMREKSEIPFN